MASPICTNCLSRLCLSSKTAHLIPPLSLSATSSFHTSAALHASPLKKKTASHASSQPKHREAKSVTMKKKPREIPKPPAQGERKALRKRIVLSNTNALEVAGMADLNAENMADPEQIGKVLGLDGALLDQLRYVKAFKTTQDWNMFRRPGTMVRTESVELGRRIQEVLSSREGEGKGPATFRQVFVGEKSTGKSLMLVQAMSMAFVNGFVVINVPEAQDLTIGQSSYAPLPSSSEGSEQEYIQPNLTAELLSRVAYANGALLKNLKLSHQHSSLPTQLGPNASLHELAMLGTEDPSNAWSIWQAFWKELTEPASNSSTTRRPPVLIAIDGIDHWMTLSKYRSAEYELVHAHQLALIQQFTSLLFAQKPAPSSSLSNSSNLTANGGMIVAATSGSNSPSTPSFDLLLRQLRALAAGMQLSDQGFPMPDPWSKVDQRVMNLLQTSEMTEVTTIKGLSKHEARCLLEYYAKSGILKENISDAVVGEKWTLSGGGVIGEMARFGTRVRT